MFIKLKKELDKFLFIYEQEEVIENYILYYGSIEFIKSGLNNFDKIEEVMEKMDLLAKKGFVSMEMLTLDNQLKNLRCWYKNAYQILNKG